MKRLEDLADAFVAASRALVGIAVHSVGAAPVEVTLPQYRLLVLVAAGEPTVGDIAANLGVNQSNATRHCDRLQRLGLLERSRSDSDARVVRVRLTAAGRNVVKAVMEQRRTDIRRVLDRMSRDDAAAALTALRAFGEAARDNQQEQWAKQLW